MDKTMENPSISVSLHRRPTNLGALVDVFGKPLGRFSSTSGSCAGKSFGSVQFVPPGTNEKDQNSLP